MPIKNMAHTILFVSAGLLSSCDERMAEKELKDVLQQEGVKNTQVISSIDTTIRQDIIYYSHGKIKEQGSYRGANKHGHRVYYNPIGTKTSQGSYIDGIKQGKWLYFSDNGKKQSEGMYEQGHKQGPWIFYDERGLKKEIVTYDNDDKTGIAELYQYGNLQAKGSYIGGKKSGHRIYFYPGKQKLEEGFYQDDVEHGEWYFYHQNGKQRMRGSYIQGTKTGERTEYDINGKAIDHANY